MKWICIKNAGEFDLVNAINMLGASVKVSDNPIGLFGSGVKYALAQAARNSIEIKISSGENVYTLGKVTKLFREKNFDVVTLKIKSKVIETPMTTDFGKEDWNDKWFIFREFYSNCLDEEGADISIVNGINPESGYTCVYLPYYTFSEYYDNLESYFTKKTGCWVEENGGSVYKKGVFVGKLEGTNICINSSFVRINECRTMDKSSAIEELRYFIKVSSIEVMKEYLKSQKELKDTLMLNIGTYDSIETCNKMHEALVSVYGKNYCICPNVEFIIKDVQCLGFTPVIEDFTNKIFNSYKNLETSAYRNLLPMEEEVFNKQFNKIKFMFNSDFKVKVFKNTHVMGEADMTNNLIHLNESLFAEDKQTELLHTIIHELGHLETGADDYSRSFTKFFIDKLTEICN